MIDVVEILQHWHAGRPKLVLAASLGVDPKTVRKYVAPAEAEGIRPNDGLVLDRAGWAAKVAGWFPELVDARARSSTWPMLEAHRELITKMLETNTVATVHQRLRDEHGLRVSVTSLRRYVWQAFPDRRRRAATLLRPLVPPGEEAQIDYGYLGRWLDPVGNRIRRVWAFVVVLACSRHMFVRPVLSMDQSSWVAAHTRGLGVLRRFARPAGHRQPEDRRDQGRPVRPEAEPGLCGDGRALRLPDRPGPGEKPKDKPRVERMMPYVRDSFWRGRSVRQRDRHADPRGGLVPARRGHPPAPQPGWRPAPASCSRRWRPRRCCRCRRHRSSWPAGCRRRSGPDCHMSR